MSARPAPVEDVRDTASPEPRVLPPPPPPEPSRARVRPKLVLAGLFVVAAAYHWLQSRSHLTPAVFTDELLHSKLAQSLAAGDGLSVRGERVFFPAPLPAVLQAPAWLADSMPVGYALAKMANAFVMSAAVFPAYWLGRQLVRPSFALLGAAAAVAAPAMLYHSYLLSEALAYPVFLLAFAVMVRALGNPSPRWGLAVLGVSVLAVGTRVQFVALPVVFLLGLLVRWRELRRHAVAVTGLAVFGVLALVGGTAALGTYAGLALVEYEPGQVLRWAVLTAALVPFAAGWLVAPGAAFGIVSLLARPRTRAERAFAFLALGVGVLFFLQVGLVAAGDSERPLERYVIYLAPLAFVAFFAYVERGAPHRRAYAVAALALGLAAWLLPFPSLADYRFSFDSPTLSAYGMLAVWAGHANAATVFAGIPLAASVVLALRRLTLGAAHVLAGAAVALLVATGIAAYAGDHAMTKRAVDAWAGTPLDWLDRSRFGEADYLGLPGGSPHFAWVLEAWNRDFRRPIWLRGDPPPNDPYAASRGEIGSDGTLRVDGKPVARGVLVVNDYATQIELDGEVLARPRGGLTVYRTPSTPHVRSLATGLFFDGWAARNLVYEVWPEGGASERGAYELELALPEGASARRVTVAVGRARRTVTVPPGRSAFVEVSVPARRGDRVPLLALTADGVQHLDGGTANPRLVSVRVLRLEYVTLASPVELSL